ncbi:MAG: hypothetical protein HYZ14_11655 [Bacteroidetes bacterium]|nr:hypothetical protein [Bacteroidota bacterium]
MSQKNFILIFLNVSYLAVHFVSFHLQISMIELWLHELWIQPEALNIIPVGLYLIVLVASIFAARDKFTKKTQSWIFAFVLFGGFLFNAIFQFTEEPEHFLFHAISALPVFGCIVYLVIYPSRILNTNQAKLIRTENHE